MPVSVCDCPWGQRDKVAQFQGVFVTKVNFRRWWLKGGVNCGDIGQDVSQQQALHCPLCCYKFWVMPSVIRNSSAPDYVGHNCVISVNCLPLACEFPWSRNQDLVVCINQLDTSVSCKYAFYVEVTFTTRDCVQILLSNQGFWDKILNI